MVVLGVLSVTLFPILTLAANDWTQPCHTGGCQWDLPSDRGSGTMLLERSHTAISDVAPVGGWTILDCDATTADQEIRLVCHDPSKCDHLYQNGAENTLVRLPEDCSSEPFAVVTRVWDHDNQSIPPSARSLLERRGSPQRSVQGISLSTDFASADFNQHGNVSVFLFGSSVPGLDTQTLETSSCDSTAGYLSSQGCNSPSTALSPLNPEEWILEALSKLAGGSQNGSYAFPDQTFQTNLFNDSLSCPQSGTVPAFGWSISVDLNSTVTGSFNYAVAVAGKLAALDAAAVSLLVSFNSTIDSTLSLDADLTGSLSTGDITLFSIGLPGLDFGSIFKIGPTFNIYAEADASIEANLELDVDILYTVSGSQLVYPSPSSPAQGTYAPGDSNVRLSAGPNVTARAQLSAHLKPSLEFGLSLAGHDTGLYLALDAFTELDLSLTAAASGSISSDGSNSTSAGAGGCVDIFTGLSVSAGADADLLGLFGPADDKVVLYDEEFDLYKTCFGDSDAFQKQKRDSTSSYNYRPAWGSGRRVPLLLFEQNLRKDHRRVPPPGAVAVMEVQAAASTPPKSGKGLSCSASPAGELAPIVSQKVNATR
ncbi:hypothetical protein GSI_09990 [Ganoderma sinense ZZ0214-1]|uniref:DUF7223 domain-containing protein n=1 Tax=Ganoderma sinense ZZ0214-1 TaxID=1077348 RepID=A0A2G8S2U6_9APHY|nr:hypothetical protein GSI_09990 [Ganoderma sinense ZZ0214-1]